MRRKTLLSLALLLPLTGLASACATPKVLVDNAFIGNSRTAKLIIRQNASSLFDEYVRICTVQADGTESACQDTLILTDVTPGATH